jgi:hypothetical protein
MFDFCNTITFAIARQVEHAAAQHRKIAQNHEEAGMMPLNILDI